MPISPTTGSTSQDSLFFEESDETDGMAKWVSLAEMDAKGLELYPTGLRERISGSDMKTGRKSRLS